MGRATKTEVKDAARNLGLSPSARRSLRITAEGPWGDDIVFSVAATSQNQRAYHVGRYLFLLIEAR